MGGSWRVGLWFAATSFSESNIASFIGPELLGLIPHCLYGMAYSLWSGRVFTFHCNCIIFVSLLPMVLSIVGRDSKRFLPSFALPPFF